MATYTGIDPGASAIKIVQGALSGPLFKLSRAAVIEVDDEGDREATILSEIQTTVAALKLKPGIVRVGVTGREVMTRYTTVPNVPLWRLRMLMDFEVKDMAESAGDGLTADYNILRSNDDGDDLVLVSLVKSALLERRLKAIEGGARQKVRGTTPNAVALFNAWMAFGERHDGEAVAIVDIGDQNVEIAVEKDGELLFARNLSGGSEMFTQAIMETWKVGVPKARELKAEFGNVTPRNRASYQSSQEEQVANALLGTAGRLAGMIASTLAFARSQAGIKDLTISRCFISGGGSNLRGLDAYLEENLRIPVKRFVPEAGLDASALPPEEREAFEADPSRFVCALGLARMSADKDAFVIDLVPEPEKKKRKFLSTTLYMAAAGVLCVAFLGFLWNQKAGERKKAADDLSAAKGAERRAVNMRRKYDERVKEATLVKEKLDELAWETRAGTFLMRGQRLVQESAPGTMWIQSIQAQKRAVIPPNVESADKKAAIEKVAVVVRGKIWGAEKPVGPLYNEFLERLRADPEKPHITDSRTPLKDGDEFEILIDFIGWPAAEERAAEGRSS